MKQGRLSLRVDRALLRDITDYAARQGTTLTRMVEQHFRDLLHEEQVRQKVTGADDTEQI